jgi:TusA-related sulfurtransferase
MTELLPQPDEIFEAYGQTCVALEPLIKLRMRALTSGQVLQVKCNDPTARLGVPAWSRLSGNSLLATADEGEGRISFFLRKK